MTEALLILLLLDAAVLIGIKKNKTEAAFHTSPIYTRTPDVFKKHRRFLFLFFRFTNLHTAM